jgi:hypothetical protein
VNQQNLNHIMNKRRQNNQSKVSSMVIFSLIVGGAIGAVGGVAHVYYRNCQIQTAREIDAVERRIERHELEIRKEQIMNLFAMKKTLEELGTDLRPIPAGVSENVIPIEPTAVASSETSL